MIKVVYDHQIFSAQKYGGVSRIFHELGTRISNYDDFDLKIHGGLYVNEYIASLPKSIVRGTKIPQIPKVTNLLLNVSRLNSYLHQKWLKTDKPEIVHKTFFSNSASHDNFAGAVNVITVYDMIHEKFMKWDTEFIKTKAEAIKSADRVICISESTRQDLLDILNIPSEKVSTVYLGNSIEPNLNPKSTRLIHEPYILYVGSRKAPHKNFQKLLEAYSKTKRLKDNFKLLCFGHRSFSQREISTMRELGLQENSIIHFSGNDSVLAQVYHHAEAFVYPSLYEGFGIPPIEAMALNCPVVCSNVSSIPEIVGNAGEYFDPNEIDSISQAIEKVVFSSTLRADLINKGQERVKFFSWDKCAMETSSIYRQII